MRPIADAAGLTPIQLACQWNLAHPAVVCAAPTLIQEAGAGSARAIEDKRAELARAARSSASTTADVAADPRIGDNTGSMALKGASPDHEGEERPDRWSLDRARVERRRAAAGIEPDRDLRRTAGRLHALTADRVIAWLVTGPVGRVAAFVADLAAYWWRWARRGTRAAAPRYWSPGVAEDRLVDQPLHRRLVVGVNLRRRAAAARSAPRRSGQVASSVGVLLPRARAVAAEPGGAGCRPAACSSARRGRAARSGTPPSSSRRPTFSKSSLSSGGRR